MARKRSPASGVSDLELSAERGTADARLLRFRVLVGYCYLNSVFCLAVG